MITAEEFFRSKIKEQNPNREVVALSQELITAEQGLRWAHEFKQLHLHAVISSICEKEKCKYWNTLFDRCKFIGKECCKQTDL